ncbi:MAG TPA: hypothetical protein VGF67_26605 [Ktedonobacteraceae bacterium]|jgi:hypothetical protein
MGISNRGGRVGIQRRLIVCDRQQNRFVAQSSSVKRISSADLSGQRQEFAIQGVRWAQKIIELQRRRVSFPLAEAYAGIELESDFQIR